MKIITQRIYSNMFNKNFRTKTNQKKEKISTLEELVKLLEDEYTERYKRNNGKLLKEKSKAINNININRSPQAIDIFAVFLPLIVSFVPEDVLKDIGVNVVLLLIATVSFIILMIGRLMDHYSTSYNNAFYSICLTVIESVEEENKKDRRNNKK